MSIRVHGPVLTTGSLDIYGVGSPLSCCLARLHSLVGGKPNPVNVG